MDTASIERLTTMPIYRGGTAIETALAAALAERAASHLVRADGGAPGAAAWDALASHLYLNLVLQPNTGGLDPAMLNFTFAPDAMAPATVDLSPGTTAFEELGTKAAPAWEAVLGIARTWLAERNLLTPATPRATRN